ncbi:MAG: GNAT family N-acetyltransferase [Vicinamibacterales bacterium]
MGASGDLRYPLVDVGLSRRLERAEAHANTRFVESRSRLAPAVRATWTVVDGAYAMFDGVGSPLTQTFCLGIFGPPTMEGLESIEAFYASRGCDAFHEVSPLADPSTLGRLSERGYRPCELTSVLYLPLGSVAAGDETGPAVAPVDNAVPLVDTVVPFDHDASAPAGHTVQARLARAHELDAWAAVAARGWSQSPEVQGFMKAFGEITTGAVDASLFIAEVDGQPMATGLAVLHEDVALLAGASTVPEARGRGAQSALLTARLNYAAEQGCTLAMMCAGPGSASQRNAERRGFRIAYTRIKWFKPLSHRERG